MNWDIIKGNWKQMKGALRQKWGKLTDDDLETLAGHKDEFIGKLQERYGYSKDQAEREVNDFFRDDPSYGDVNRGVDRDDEMLRRGF